MCKKDELLEYVIQDINSIYSDYSLQKSTQRCFSGETYNVVRYKI